MFHEGLWILVAVILLVVFILFLVGLWHGYNNYAANHGGAAPPASLGLAIFAFIFILVIIFAVANYGLLAFILLLIEIALAFYIASVIGFNWFTVPLLVVLVLVALWAIFSLFTRAGCATPCAPSYAAPCPPVAQSSYTAQPVQQICTTAPMQSCPPQYGYSKPVYAQSSGSSWGLPF